MKRVQILDRCFHCGGQSYIFKREVWSLHGDGHEKYKPCPCCNGTGELATWINLKGIS